MNVQQLIKKLKKMPSESLIVFAAHDNPFPEFQGYVTSIHLHDYDDFMNGEGEDMGARGKIVTLSY